MKNLLRKTYLALALGVVALILALGGAVHAGLASHPTGYHESVIQGLFARYGYSPADHDLQWWGSHRRNQWGDLEWNLARRRKLSKIPKTTIQVTCTDAEFVDCPLGTAIPTVVALFETSLQSKITSSETSMTLVDGSDKAGTALSGTFGFIIDEGSSDEEFVLATCTSTACSSMTRGLSVITGNTAVTALQKAHRRGASVKMTEFPILGILARILNGTESVPNLLFYESQPTYVGATTTAIATKKYVDDTNNTGAADADETTKGITELATAAEAAAGTSLGGTGARLSVPNSRATSTPSDDATFLGQGRVPTSESDGKLHQRWFDLSEGWTFTGNLNINGGLQFGGTQFTASTTPNVLNGINTGLTGSDIGRAATTTIYYGDGRDGAQSTSGATTFNSTKTVITSATSSAAVVNVASISGFAAGDKVFLHQTRGTGAGLWELATISSTAGSSLTMRDNLVNNYQFTDAQAIKVPQRTTIVMGTGTTIGDTEWNASLGTGGVVVLMANRGIIVEHDVTLSLNSFGYQGGSMLEQSGEGTSATSTSGVSDTTGNGGGSGINSGAVTGKGGTDLVDSLSTYFSGGSSWNNNGLVFIFGGGGGTGASASGSEGEGGDGGGILVVFTPQWLNFGTITSNGGNGTNCASNCGGGGSGGGGTIAICADSIYNRVTPTIAAGTAGTGNGTGKPGGGGGGNALDGSDGTDPNGGAGGVGMLYLGCPSGVVPYR